jgi:glycosyltransferase involved in cell wall biosynthesis
MVSTFYPPHIGGIEHHVENLSRELVKKGHNVTILTSALSKFPSTTLSNDNITIVRIKAYFPFKSIYSPVSNQGFLLNIKGILKEIITEKKIDIVHAHGHHYYLTWRTISAADKLGIPVILTLHGLNTLNRCNVFAKKAEGIFNQTIFRSELRKVNAVIGLTPHITDCVRKYNFASKNCYTVPNGVNFKLYDQNINETIRYREKYGIDSDKIVILFIGRFAQIKGIIELAEAAKDVVKKKKHVFFVFVGGGPLSSLLTKTLKSIEANSKVIGWIPQEKIYELYIASNVFVLPSKSEALPLTILEAMAARLKIIAASVGGVPEILKNYPQKIMIKNGTTSEISNAILNTLKGVNEVAINAGQPIDRSYMESFDWEKIACKVERIYQATRHDNIKFGVLHKRYLLSST